jgi:dsRNA-specific ribonuclease
MRQAIDQTKGADLTSRAGKDSMTEEEKKMEAIGDALLMVCARLYLSKHNVAYQLFTRITSRMVCNATLARIAEMEGIPGLTDEQKSKADALELELARLFYREGFAAARVWTWTLFDRYIDIKEEVRKILEPSPDDKLTRQVRGALKMVIGQQGGKVTGSNLDEVTKQLVGQLRNGSSL